jgi:hypothetical protein
MDDAAATGVALMAQAMHSGDTLQGVLRRMTAKQRQARLGARLLWRVWLWLAVLLVLVLLDPILLMPTWARWLAAGGLLAYWPVVAWRQRKPAPAPRHEEQALALERHHGLDDNALINGCALRSQAQQGDLLAGRLALRAVARADAIAQRVDPEGCVDRSAFRREGARLLSVLAVLASLAGFQPDLLRLGAMRLALPWIDQPPFSLTRMTVVVRPYPPVRGEELAVRVQFAGLIPGEAELVELDDSGRTRRRWTMQRLSHESYQHIYTGLLEPMTVRVVTPGGWSKSVRIEPTNPPASPEPMASGVSPASLEDEPGSGPQGETGDVSAQSLQALAQRAQAIERQAQSGQGDESLRPSLDAFAREAQALREALQQAGSESPPERASWREALEGLRLPQVGAMPADAGARDQWSEQVASAARQDAGELQQAAAGQKGGDAQSEHGQTAWQDQPSPPRDPTPAPAGQYHEAGGSSEGDPRGGRAAARQAPPAYRRLVEAYFDRVARDQGDRSR